MQRSSQESRYEGESHVLLTIEEMDTNINTMTVDDTEVIADEIGVMAEATKIQGPTAVVEETEIMALDDEVQDVVMDKDDSSEFSLKDLVMATDKDLNRD